MNTPAIVVGSGISGLRFSLYLAEHRPVTIFTKKEAVESNTNYAQGGIAVVLRDDDSIDLHLTDTLGTGGGLTDPEIARLVVTEGPALVQNLIDLGAEFERTQSGELVMGREGGHSRARVVHSADATGHEIERVLLHAAETHPNITILPFHVVMDVVVRDGRCVGVMVLEPDRRVHVMPTDLVCFSTGGLGRTYKFTTNPEIATGDGVAMGYRAGALIRDLEFIQFHPTALARPGAGSFLISEAVRGEGGILKTIDGYRFMQDYDAERMELAPRDVVARAIDSELKKRGDPHVLLHLEHLGADFLKRRFPTIYATCLLHEIAIDRQPIPVVPAAHYSCGGVATDAYARTSIAGLYSIGETASHGLHGANRLASNSLLEALVFSARGAEAAAQEPARAPALKDHYLDLGDRSPCGMTSMYADRLRAVMTAHVGIFRHIESLRRASMEVSVLLAGVRRLLKVFALNREVIELANMAQCCEIIVKSALDRRESRGLHFVEEYPALAPGPARHSDFTNPDPAPLFNPGL